jgi:methylated-DNA-[protein]-cysteine S-methyltransferase
LNLTNQINIQFYKNPYAEFILGSFAGKLCLLDFRYRKMRGAVDKRIKRGLGAEFVEEDDPILQAARVQIDEYFAGIRETFNIPLLMVGSDFQKSVWKALLEVPYGETISYLQLSQCIDNVKAIRAWLPPTVPMQYLLSFPVTELSVPMETWWATVAGCHLKSGYYI